MDNFGYAVRVFKQHIERGYSIDSLKGKVVLEIGPGDSVATAIIASAYGARAVLIDVAPFASKDLSFYYGLSDFLKGIGGSPPDINSCSSVDEILKVCSAEYLTNGLKSISSLNEDSIDFIFSQAVLEHIRKQEFLEFMSQCRRVLKPSGISSHTVDLKDHLGGSLNNLHFSEKLWESELFKLAGFNIDVISVSRWKSLPTAKSKLSWPFRELTDEQLCISGFNVVCK